MLRSSWATGTALFAAVVLFAASARSQCVPYNSSNTAGYPEQMTFASPVYFACPDDLFLVTIEASYESITPAIQVLTWTCSAAEDVRASAIVSSSSEASLSFTVGITEVTTRVVDGTFPYLTHMHIGGYDLDTTGADIVFESKGPFGDFEDEASVLPDTPFSLCSSGSFATGMTVWAFADFVFGVMLECAYVTTTCAPLAYPAGLLEDGSDSATYGTTSASSAVTATDPPSTSASPVATTDPPSSSGDIVPSFDTPSPSTGTSFAAVTPSPSVNIQSTGGSSSSSATTIIAGASVAGGLCVLAICVGLACGFHRREARKKRHPARPQDTFGMPVIMGGREGGGGFTPNAGTVTHVVYVNADPLAAEPSSTSDPPPPYSERPLYQAAPLPSYP